MAKTFSEYLANKKKQEETEGSRQKTFSDYKAQRDLGTNFGGDVESVNNAINSMRSEWQDATTMSANRSALADIANRATAARNYVAKNRDMFSDTNEYKKALGDLDALSSQYSNALKEVDTYQNIYNQYKNAEAYNTGKAQMEKAKEKQAKYDTSKYDAMSYDELVKERDTLDSQKTAPAWLSKALSALTPSQQRPEKFKADATEAYDKQYALEQINSRIADVGYRDKVEKLDDETKQLLADFDAARTLQRYAGLGKTSVPGNTMVSADIAQAEADERVNATKQALLGTINPNTNKRFTEEEIADYADYLAINKGKREAAESAKKNAELATEHPLLGVGKRTADVFVGGIGSTFDTLGQSAELAIGNRRNIDVYNPAFQYNRNAQTIDQTIMDNNDFMVGDVDLFDFGYKVATSVADNALRTVAGGGNPTVAAIYMATQGFGQTVQDSVEKGYSPTKAIANGVINAGIEAITEKYSLEKILDQKTAKSILVALGKSFLAEGSEEVAGDALSAVADAIMNGNYAEIATQYNELVANGTAPKQALAEVAKNQFGDLVESFLVGGFSGAAMGGGVYLSQFAGNAKNKVANAIGGKVSDIRNTNALMAGNANVQAAADLNVDTETNDRYKKALEAYKAVSENATKKETKSAQKELKSAARKVASQLRLSTNEKVTSALKTSLNEELSSANATEEQIKSVEKLVDRKILTEADNKNIEDLRDSVGADKLQEIFQTANNAARSESAKIQVDAALKAGAKTLPNTDDYNKTQNGDTVIHNDNAVEVVGIDAKSGNITLSDKSVVKPSEIEMSEDMADVIEGVKNIGRRFSIESGDLNTIFAYAKSAIGNNTNSVALGLALDDAMMFGYIGQKDLNRSAYIESFGNNPVAMRAINEAYKMAAESSRLAKNTESVKVSKSTEKGTIRYEDVNISEYSEDKQTEAKAVESISSLSPIETVIYDSSKRTDDFATKNGAFYKDGRLWVDINAEQGVLGAFAHELTHFMREYNEGSFNKIARILISEYGSGKYSAMDAADIARNYANSLKMTVDDAFEEYVADCMTRMLTDSNAAETIAKLRAEDAKLADKIASFIRDAVAKIKAALSGTKAKGYSEITKSLDRWQELADLFAEGVAGAMSAYENVNYSYGVTQSEIDEYVEKSKSKENDKDYKKYATVSNKLISDVSNDIDLSGYSHALRDNDIRHILNSHGESTNEKYPVTLNDVKSIPFIVENYDKVFYKTNDKGQPGIVYVKVGSNNVVYYVEAITEKYGAEKLLINKQMLKTGIDDIPNLFGLKNAITKKQTESEFLSDLLQIRKAYARSEYQNQSVNNSISPSSEKVNNKNSAKDSEGKMLTEQQSEYFKNSKVRDVDGNLLVVYHGTDAEFTVFDISRGRPDMDIQGAFFSPDKADAEGYGVAVKPYYINLTNPADFDTAFSVFKKLRGEDNAGVKTREELIRLGYDGVNNGDEFIAFYPEQIKLTSNEKPTSDVDVRYSEKDSEYLELAKNPEKNEARLREMVDEAAKAAMPNTKVIDDNGNPKVVYHGTFFDFNVFDLEKTANANIFGKGFYFTTNESDAINNYATNKGADVKTKIEDLATFYFEEMGHDYEDQYDNEFVSDWNASYDKAEEFYKSGRVLATYLNIANPLYADENGNLVDANGAKKTYSSSEFAIAQGYDGIIDRYVSKRFSNVDSGTTHYIAFNSSQIKSADLVTYDDNGNIIPLSERFNNGNEDIRYSERGNGYDGYSMSNNARDAYANGEMPLSKWRKSDILYAVEEMNPSIDCSMLTLDTLRDKFLKRSSWHHTSMYYNRTDFYSINEEYVKGLSQTDVDNLAASQTSKPVVKRDVSLDEKIDEAFVKMKAIIESGIVKTEKGALKRLIDGKDFDADYAKAVEIIRARDAKKVNEWRNLPAEHYRQKQVELYDNDIGAYIKALYANEKLSRNSNVFNEIRKHFAEQASAEIVNSRKGPPIDITAETEYSEILKKLKDTQLVTGKSFKEYAKAKEKSLRHAEYAREKLVKENEQLAEMVRLQRKQTNGKVITPSSINTVAKRIYKESGARGNVDEFAKLLGNLYNGVINGEEITLDMNNSVVDWLVEHHKAADKNADYQAVRKFLRGSKVYLSPSLRTEIEALYGSVAEYSRLINNAIKFTNEETDARFDDVWADLTNEFSEFFDGNATEINQPAVLADVLDALESSTTELQEYQDSLEDVKMWYLELIYEGYADVSTLRTVADQYGDKILKLKLAQKKKIAELKRESAARLAEVEKAYKEEKREFSKAKTAEREELRKELVAKYTEMRKRNVEGRSKTVEKNKILRAVKELDTLLNKGNKKRNVKIGMEDLVEKALYMTDVLFSDVKPNQILRGIISGKIQANLAEREKTLLDEYEIIDSRPVSQDDSKAKREKAKDLLAIETQLKELVEREKNAVKNRAYAAMNSFGDAYEELKNSEQSYISDVYNKDIAERIKNFAKEIKGTPVEDLTAAQMHQFYEVIRMVSTTISNANKEFVMGQARDTTELGESTGNELAGGKDTRLGAFDPFKRFLYADMKPVFYFEHIGSKTLKTLFDNVREGEKVFARDVEEARDFILQTKEKYGFDEWDLDKVKTFKLTSGQDFKINLNQMMSIYAYSRREQALEHMAFGGFKFADKTMKDTDKKFKPNIRNTSRETFRVNSVDFRKIADSLTEEQKKYVVEMQNYLTAMGAKGNEVSRKLYGIDIFKERVYFPLRTAKEFMKSADTIAANKQLENSGFTKETVPNADNPIILDNFTDVWGEHINQMSLYHSMTLPIRALRRTFEYTGIYSTGKSESVRTIMTNRFDKFATNYLDKFIQDLNGGITSEESSFLSSLFTKMKKSAVAASTSVVIQQPTAIARAMALINPKYFVAPKAATVDVKKNWEEAKRYAPVVIIKEIGGFDTGAGKGVSDWLNSAEYSGFKNKLKGFAKDSQYRDDVLSAGAEFADEVGWSIIWEAVKKETADKTNLTGEDLLKAAGKRFDEVIIYTQVYDSVTSRSSFMRSRAEINKMATAFMGEPTTSINLLSYAIIESKRGKITKAHAGRIVAATLSSIVFAAIAKCLPYALRDDDDDKTFAEKYVDKLTDALFGLGSDIAPWNMVPYLKDLISIWQGYDVDRADITIVSDLVKAIKGLDSTKKSGWVKMENLLGSIGALFGVPVKNLMRTMREIYNLFLAFING